MQDGYYRVLPKGRAIAIHVGVKWQVAQYCDGCWYFCGSDVNYDGDEIVVGTRVEFADDI